MRRTGLLPCLILGMLPSVISTAGESAGDAATAPVELPIIPLSTLGTVKAFEGSFLAWAGPVFCDADENAYFLLIPDSAPKGVTTGADPQRPRDLVRVSADGKKKLHFNPAGSPKLAGATELTTIAAAVDKDGTVFLLVWARWDPQGDQPERGAQYLVSFDRKGEYQSSLEVDWEQILVQQLEVFGTGEFLLRGRRTNTPEVRIAILSAGGGALQDVAGWAGLPSAPLEELSTAVPKFDQMARGADGRIYVAQQETQPDRDVVYAFGPSGQTEEVFQLRAMPGNPRFTGLKVAGDRFAATYFERQSGAEDGRGKSWVAVYGNVSDPAALETTIYGPTPGAPICYQHRGSKDVFTFLADGANLVAMSSP